MPSPASSPVDTPAPTERTSALCAPKQDDQNDSLDPKRRQYTAAAENALDHAAHAILEHDVRRTKRARKSVQKYSPTDLPSSTQKGGQATTTTSAPYKRKSRASKPSAAVRSSRFRGVRWNKKGRKWEANLGHANQQYYLGAFSNEEAAGHAYDQAALQHKGFDYTGFNFPDKIRNLVGSLPP